MSEVEMTVWIAVGESRIAPQRRRGQALWAWPAAVWTGSLDPGEDLPAPPRVPGEGDGEARIDPSTHEAAPRCWADLHLLGVVSEIPGDCSPSSEWCRKYGCGYVRCGVPSDSPSLLESKLVYVSRGYRAAQLFTRGWEEKEKRKVSQRDLIRLRTLEWT